MMRLLVCPLARSPLRRSGGRLITDDSVTAYETTPSGIPLFATEFLSAEAKAQQKHFDRVAVQYFRNLSFPHTQEYYTYLDEELLSIVEPGPLGIMAELCCGHGEAIALLGDRAEAGLGIDVSIRMLEEAREKHPGERLFFVQADATNLPLMNDSIDTVVMLGGIHHIIRRDALFAEIFRVLKPGGRFYWRDPADDFLPWRLLRRLIYKISPALDHLSERPLRYEEVVPKLRASGFAVEHWKTFGFFGFCLFMNSDVLVFNRLFRFFPGIRRIVRKFIALDKVCLKLPGLERAGLQVVGSAVKPQA